MKCQSFAQVPTLPFCPRPAGAGGGVPGCGQQRAAGHLSALVAGGGPAPGDRGPDRRLPTPQSPLRDGHPDLQWYVLPEGPEAAPASPWPPSAPAPAAQGGGRAHNRKICRKGLSKTVDWGMRAEPGISCTTVKHVRAGTTAVIQAPRITPGPMARPGHIMTPMKGDPWAASCSASPHWPMLPQ